ncbi:MAG: UDP-N-acetylmuramoyl-tripeptide--D-alanyl-D-alanine ligase [Dehalococcoidia bacterium]|nr:UDP-N-acetylmuramoyl-tripeptide--D-alanyl-D-alanine ligase [Dehalococcoidia bacterium]
MLTMHDVAVGVGAPLLQPLSALTSRSFSNVTIDSRTVAPGALFVALRGERTDGHQHIAAAIRNGATGVLAQRWPEDVPADLREQAVLFAVADPLVALQQLATHRRAQLAVRTVGVTGSVGKTSTKEAIAHLLARRFSVHKSTGNFNSEIGLPLVLLQLIPEHQKLVVEMGMHYPGDVALLCAMARPHVGLVTNVGPTHLERVGSIQGIADAKAELPASLPPDGVAVLNADDALVTAMSSRTAAAVVYYGMTPGADLRATEVRTHGLDGLTFDLVWQGERRSIRTRLIGRHNVYTALAAAAVALIEGMTLDEVCEGIASLPDSTRVKVRHTRAGALVLDDTYNASPASVTAALDILADVPGRRVAILADMLELGPEEGPGHQQVGRHAARQADALIAIGPRARAMADAALEAGLTDVQHFPSKEDALDALRAQDHQGTVLLFKGSRGMALDELADSLCDRAD